MRRKIRGIRDAMLLQQRCRFRRFRRVFRRVDGMEGIKSFLGSLVY
jgi:hypothetical protein